MAEDPEWYAPPVAESPVAATADLPALQPEDTAGFKPRGFARIIDAIALTVLGGVGGAVTGVLLSVLASLHLVRSDWLSARGSSMVANLIVGTVASLAYHVAADAFGGATLGKLVLGLRVRRADGGPCGVGAAIVRNLAYYVDAFFFGLVAHSAMQSSRMNQRVGDGWAKTVVVRAESLPASARGEVALGNLVAVAANVFVIVASSVVRAL